MKTIIKFTLLAISLIISFNGLAQRYGDGQPTTMDVNGIFLYGKYTKTQVIAKWGTPTNYRSHTSEFGLDEEYSYSSNLFRFSDNGIFVESYINTSKFVFWASKSGGFKVGDTVSRLKTIGVIPNNTIIKTGSGENVLQIPGGDDRFEVGYSNGIITYISYISSL
jgi:hypothetical protein